MRKLILTVAILCGTSAHAIDLEKMAAYQAELQEYSDLAKQTHVFWLMTTWSGDAAMRMAGTCASGVVITAAAISCDTVPMTNPVAEFIASHSDKNYQGIGDLLAWETWAKAGPGAAGGATVAVYETLENWIRYTSGNKIDWSKFAQVYASTVATAENQLGEQSRCWVNLAKFGLIRAEVMRRARQAVSRPMTPMVQPR